MFTPKYSISDVLLANIKRIAVLIEELNHQRFLAVVLLNFEKTARAVSSHASTGIEGNPLPLTEVKKILRNQPAYLRSSEREVVNYNRALEYLSQWLEGSQTEISVKLLLRVHGMVVDSLLPKSENTSFRKKPVVVNNPQTREVVFLPPNHDQVPRLVSELLEFVKRSQAHLDPLLVAGLFHKQLVLIHPFIDGNGRTTRLMTKLLLAKLGLNTFHLFSFEQYYNKNVSQYFQTVGEFGDYYELREETSFTPWLEYFTEGIIDELFRVQVLLSRQQRSPATTLQKHHKALLKLIEVNGYVNDRQYATVTNRARSTRAKDFLTLIDMGLIERRGGSRSTYYVLKDQEAVS